eukprot:scaffold4889_cov108-Isochrysis_galbana.AAC.2
MMAQMKDTPRRSLSTRTSPTQRIHPGYIYEPPAALRHSPRKDAHGPLAKLLLDLPLWSGAVALRRIVFAAAASARRIPGVLAGTHHRLADMRRAGSALRR